VTPMVPPMVGMTVDCGPLVVLVGCGAVVVTVTTGGGTTVVCWGGGRVVGGADGTTPSAVVCGAPGAETVVLGVVTGAEGVLTGNSVVDDTAKGASARSTSRGDTTISPRVVMPDSTFLTAPHASPLVTAVPRIHAPAMAIRVRTPPLSSHAAVLPRGRASNHP